MTATTAFRYQNDHSDLTIRGNHVHSITNMTQTNIMPFAGFPLDRASVRRRDGDYIAGLLEHPDSDLILIQDGRPVLELPTNPKGLRRALRLNANARTGFLGSKAPAPLFLGLDTKGRATFAAGLPRGVEMDSGPLEGLGEAVDLRMAAGVMDMDDLALVSTGKALLDWHARHGFCANCGTKTEIVEAGWKRACGDCGTEHFPRTDPVAIMLAVNGDKCLLGRGPGFRAGFISALAGFIEPGETIEEGCARELMEEAGVTMTSARIIANQPWPFPSQLMIGLIAEVSSLKLTLDTEELAEAIWFTRDQARDLLSDGGCKIEGLTLRAPPPMAIAHHLIMAWVSEG
jgi:NAD+ diphosphatase